MSYEFHKLSPHDENTTLYGAWGELLAEIRHARFYHRSDWCRSVGVHFFPDSVEFHCAYRGSDLVAVFPLMRSVQQSPIGEFVCQEVVLDPELGVGDFIVHPDHVGPHILTALIEHLNRPGAPAWDVLRCRRVTARSVARRMARAFNTRLTVQRNGEAVFCDCSDRAALTKLSRKNLHNIRRLRDRAEAECGTLEMLSFEGENVLEGLERFVDVEASGWKGPRGSGTAIACRPRRAAFYRDVVADFGMQSSCRVDLLRLGGEDAAGQLSLASAGGWDVLKIGYDAKFRTYGPGAILMSAFLRTMAASDGVSEVSLVTGPNWAQRWHMASEPVFDVRLFRGNVRGRALWGALRLKMAGRQFAGPPGSDPAPSMPT